jgi:hypothetical protein
MVTGFWSELTIRQAKIQRNRPLPWNHTKWEFTMLMQTPNTFRLVEQPPLEQRGCHLDSPSLLAGSSHHSIDLIVYFQMACDFFNKEKKTMDLCSSPCRVSEGLHSATDL